jgi:hypothetical protein
MCQLAGWAWRACFSRRWRASAAQHNPAPPATERDRRRATVAGSAWQNGPARRCAPSSRCHRCRTLMLAGGSPITLKSGEPFAFAGFWSLGYDGQYRPRSTFAILTTAANRLVAKIHQRMPVILYPEAEAIWLNPEVSPAQAQACLKPFPGHLLQITAVSPKMCTRRGWRRYCVSREGWWTTIAP